MNWRISAAAGHIASLRVEGPTTVCAGATRGLLFPAQSDSAIRRFSTGLLLAFLLLYSASGFASAEVRALDEVASRLGLTAKSGPTVIQTSKGPMVVPGARIHQDQGIMEVSVTVSVSGPIAGELPPLRGATRTAPWGADVQEDWQEFADRSAQPRQPDAPPVPDTPAVIQWNWSYPNHVVTVVVRYGYDDRNVTLAQAESDLIPLAELLHRGMVAQGLDAGVKPGAGRYRALIRIPPIRPGEVLSPSVDVIDENGKPPAAAIRVSWFINGVNRPSVIWDGRETRVEVQVSVPNHQAVVAEVLLPAFVPGSRPGDAVPVAPATAPSAGDAPASPVPGLRGVGPLPGPGSVDEALIGMLLPPALIALLQLLAQWRGAPAPLPTVATTGRSAPAQRMAANRERPESGVQRVTSGPTPDRAVWERRLVNLDRVARHDNNAELAAAVASVRQQLEGPTDPAAWVAAQGELRDALGRLDQALPPPNGVAWDAAASTAGAVGEAAGQVGEVLTGVVDSLRAFPGQVWQGLQGIGDAVLNPGHFISGVGNTISDWIGNNLKMESQKFEEALARGDEAGMYSAIGRGTLKAIGLAQDAAWEQFVKPSLPVDEIRSFADPHASTEEKLWAVPAIAVKIAGILAGAENPGLKASTRWGKALDGIGDALENRGLVAAGQQAAQKVDQLEAQVKSLEAVAVKRPDSTIKQLLDRNRKALEQARNARQATQKALEVQQQAQQILSGRAPVQNFQQAQQLLKDNPALTASIDDAIRANQGGNTLYDMRSQGLMSRETHQLMTARKLELQQQAVNAASKRAIEEEVRALQAAGQPVPHRFHTFNATQGSRSNLAGSNIQADFDQTVMGLRHVDKERMEDLIRQECHRLGMTEQQLDINIYQDLMDGAGSAPNAQVTLENIGQTTGTSGHHTVYVDPSGDIHVGNHVSSPQGREGVLAGKATATRPPGVSEADWQLSLWEGHQGAPVRIPSEQWPDVRATQIEGFRHALERGDLNQMIKYANRARAVGLPMDCELEAVIRKAAGHKDPFDARQMLKKAGIHSPADLADRLGLH